MIFDDLENLNQYYGLFDNLDKAIAYIDENGLDGLPDGRTDIDGDDVYVTVGPRTPGPAEDAPFETHSRYMDIHVVLEGSELAEAALGELTAREPYDEAADTALWDAATSAARHADVIVPEGGKNAVALDMIIRRVEHHLAGA